MNLYKIFDKKILILFCLVGLFIFLTSCKSSNDVEVEFRNGISVQILEMVGEENIAILENELDFPIYRGKNPPDVEEMLLASSFSPPEPTVVMSPAFLQKTNVPGEANQEGLRFRDILVRFNNQSMSNLTIEFDRIVLGSSPYLGDQAFIIGDENQFTVFGKQEDIIGQDTVVSVNFFSGTIEDAGISSPKGGIMVLDNRGLQQFLPNNTGRLFVDGDDFADLDKWPSTGEPGVFGETHRDWLNTYINDTLNTEVQSN